MAQEWVALFYGATVLLKVHAVTKQVFMDRYGDCYHDGPFQLQNDAVLSVYALGGAAYDTLICDISFKSQENYRICVSFKGVEINRRDVSLTVFNGNSSMESIMGIYNHLLSHEPETLCTNGMYLTLVMKKDVLSHDGYNFSLGLKSLKQDDAFKDGVDAFIISTVVAVTLILTTAGAFTVYHCYKTNHFGWTNRQKYNSVETDVAELAIVEHRSKNYNDKCPAYSTV